MHLQSLLALGLAGLAASLPTTTNGDSGLGLKFDKGTDGLPTLTLPYATYRASEYDSNGDVSSPLTIIVLLSLSYVS